MFHPVLERTNTLIRLAPCRNADKAELLLSRLPERAAGAELFRVRNTEAAMGLFKLLRQTGRRPRLLLPGQIESEQLQAEAWFNSADNPSLIVAETLALPAGRRDVRSLYAMNLPASLLAALADMAVVGRDGLDASAEFFASSLDRDHRMAEIDSLSVPENGKKRLDELNQTVTWLEHDGCARQFLWQHVFNKEVGVCGHCAWCLGKKAAFLPGE